MEKENKPNEEVRLPNVFEKLALIQANLKAPKGQFNDFGKYKYRSCEDILEAVKPLLAKVGALVTLSDELYAIGDRYYVKAVATFIDIKDGTTISNTAFAREEEIKKGMDGSQITGTASSYARKYALNGLFAIDDTKDADALNTKVEPITKEQIARLKELNVNEVNVLKKFKVSKLEELTYENAAMVIRMKEKSLAANEGA